MHAYMYWYGDVPMEYVNFEISWCEIFQIYGTGIFGTGIATILYLRVSMSRWYCSSTVLLQLLASANTSSSCWEGRRKERKSNYAKTDFLTELAAALYLTEYFLLPPKCPHFSIYINIHACTLTVARKFGEGGGVDRGGIHVHVAGLMSCHGGPSVQEAKA